MSQHRHPYIGVSPTKFINEIAKHGGVSFGNIPKAFTIALYSLLFSRAKYKEAKLYQQKIEETQIEKPPIFILGHWRSGTTLLENILCEDPYFGYLNIIQSIFPYSFLTMEDFFQKRMKAKSRMMDNVKLSPTSPSEEEIALAVLAKGSFWHGYYFPHHIDKYFQKYMMFDGITEEELSAWKDAYVYLLKKLTLKYEGKQLILKNPPNTSRIKMLLQLFPDAKFVHIYRNPYKVYLSRMGQYKSSVLPKALQSISDHEWEEKVLQYYAKIMNKHFEESKLIPPNNYIEIRFEDLKSSPLQEIEKIYQAFQLDHFPTAKQHFEQYLMSVKGYKQNKYEWDPAVIEKVTQHWGFTIDRWGYEPPHSSERK